MDKEPLVRINGKDQAVIYQGELPGGIPLVVVMPVEQPAQQVGQDGPEQRN